MIETGEELIRKIDQLYEETVQLKGMLQQWATTDPPQILGDQQLFEEKHDLSVKDAQERARRNLTLAINHLLQTRFSTDRQTRNHWKNEIKNVFLKNVTKYTEWDQKKKKGWANVVNYLKDELENIYNDAIDLYEQEMLGKLPDGYGSMKDGEHLKRYWKFIDREECVWTIEELLNTDLSDYRGIERLLTKLPLVEDDEEYEID